MPRGFSPKCVGLEIHVADGTIAVSTASAVTSHRRGSTLAKNLPSRGLETNNPSLHQTQGDSPRQHITIGWGD
jgi:hypothetical protein